MRHPVSREESRGGAEGTKIKNSTETRRRQCAVSTADWAVRSIERYGLKLVPLHGKVPIRDAWNTQANLISTSQEAREYWTRHPTHNMGVCLEPSGLVSIDADYEDGARLVLADHGIDLDALMTTTPTIIGRAPRLEFAAPPGLSLSRKSVVWPAKTPGEKPKTVIEFRGGFVQDVLPPSRHPNTQQPYRWRTPPRDGFPALPDAILRLWLSFDTFKHRARNLCPWADPEPAPIPQPTRAPRYRSGPSVIAEFNAAHDAVSILESCGYQRVAAKRWRSPNGSGMAGVVALPDGKVFCHHASDEGLGDGYAHDAFDVYRILQHRGDFRAAVRAAAVALGMSQGAT